MKSNSSNLEKEIEQQEKEVAVLYDQASKKRAELRELKLKWIAMAEGLEVGCRIVTRKGDEFQVETIGDFSISRKGDSFIRPTLYGYKIKKDGTMGRQRRYIGSYEEWTVKKQD